MGIDTGVALSVARTALDEVFRQGYNIPAQESQAWADDVLVFNQQSVDRAAHITQQQQPVGYFSERAEKGAMPEDTIRVGNSQTVVIREWNNSISVPRTFRADDQHGTVNESTRSFGERARISQARNAFVLYRGAFGATDTNDGANWGSGSHTRLDSGTADNLETGTLTPTNLETVITALIQQPDQKGVLPGFAPRVLVVPPALLREAAEITESQLRPDTANNAINYVSRIWPNLEIRWSQFISAAAGGTDTQYHVLSDNHSAKRLTREGLWTELVDWVYQSDNQYIYKAGYREDYTVVSYEGSIHSDGTV